MKKTFKFKLDTECDEFLIDGESNGLCRGGVREKFNVPASATKLWIQVSDKSGDYLCDFHSEGNFGFTGEEYRDRPYVMNAMRRLVYETLDMWQDTTRPFYVTVWYK